MHSPLRHVFLFVGVIFSSPNLVCQASLGWDACQEHFPNLQTPDYISGHVPICRGGYYALSYDATMQNPSWAAYKITKKNVTDKIAGRVSGFRKDPDLNALKIDHPSTSNDAYSTLWNRGHVAPSAILSATYDSKYNTYYTSNIAPQWWQFNQQPWATLESRVLDFILDKYPQNDSHIFIVTGVGYANRSDVVKVDDVATPTYFYKAICDPQAKQSVAFIGNNSEDGGGLLETYRSVADVGATAMCGVDINATLGRSATAGFRIFPNDGSCGTLTSFDATHWGFKDYVDHAAQGFNCSTLSAARANAGPSLSATSGSGGSGTGAATTTPSPGAPTTPAPSTSGNPAASMSFGSTGSSTAGTGQNSAPGTTSPSSTQLATTSSSSQQLQQPSSTTSNSSLGTPQPASAVVITDGFGGASPQQAVVASVVAFVFAALM